MLIDPSGEWHTINNDFESHGRRRHGSICNTERVVSASENLSTGHRLAIQVDDTSDHGASSAHIKRSNQQVLTLCDSDEEEESIVTRELSRLTSPQRSSGTRETSGSVAPAPVIDLTLDSDEEERLRPRGSNTLPRVGTGEKRKRTLDDHGRRSHTLGDRSSTPIYARTAAAGRSPIYMDETVTLNRSDPRFEFTRSSNNVDYFQRRQVSQQPLSTFGSGSGENNMYRSSLSSGPRSSLPLSSTYLPGR